MYQRRPRRRGLTLMEMVLTIAIGMLVMLAVFMLMQTQYLETQAGREAIEDATLARNILMRVGNDISNSLGPVDPRFLPVAILPNNANQGVTPISGGGMGGGAAGGGAAGGSAAGGGATKPASAAGAAASASSPGSSSSTSSTPSTSSNGSSSAGGTTQTPAPFNLGLRGDAKWLVLSSSRIPRAVLANPKTPATDDSIASGDLRSVSIWLVEGAGLARAELDAVTSEDAPTAEPSFSDANKRVFAPQVVDVLFEYFDGANWQTSWDGGQLGGDDGNTPLGPPAAIAVTITLKPPHDSPDAQPHKYKHVVALPASNAFTQANQSGGSPTLSGTTLMQALQAGQQIPPANQQSSSGSSSASPTTGQ